MPGLFLLTRSPTCVTISPMRILLISGEYPPMQGGVGDYTREMARSFVTLGHEVWVLVPQTLQADHPVPAVGSWYVRCASSDLVPL